MGDYFSIKILRVGNLSPIALVSNEAALVSGYLTNNLSERAMRAGWAEDVSAYPNYFLSSDSHSATEKSWYKSNYSPTPVDKPLALSMNIA